MRRRTATGSERNVGGWFGPVLVSALLAALWLASAPGLVRAAASDVVASDVAASDAAASDAAASNESGREPSGWPAFQGPTGDARVADPGPLLERWGDDGSDRAGPPELWRRELGEGFSQVVVSGRRLFVLFTDGDREIAAALEAADGMEVWRRDIGARFVDEWGNGPRASPVLHDGRLFVVGTEGVLFALAPDDGEVLWRLDLEDRFGAAQPTPQGRGGLPEAEEPDSFGHASTPRAVDDLLLVYTAATDGPSLVALDAATGGVRWTTLEGAGVGHSSPTVATLDGVRQIVQVVPHRLVGLSLETGEELWSHPWAWVQVSQPIVVPPDRLFSSTVNGWGAQLLRVTHGGSTSDGDDAAWTVEELWRQRKLGNSWAGSIVIGDAVCGFDNASFRCLDLETGALRLTHRGMGKGNYLLAGDDLAIVLSDRGELVVGRVDGASFDELGRRKIFEGPAYTLPSLADGVLYLRNHSELVALDLRASGLDAVEPAERAVDATPSDPDVPLLTGDALMRAVAEALGGEEAWAAIDMLVLEGDHTSFSRTLPFRIVRQRPDRMRFEFHESTRPAVVVIDGDRAWWLKTFVNESFADWPTPIPAPYVPSFRGEAQLEPPFLRPGERGIELIDRGAIVDPSLGRRLHHVEVRWPWTGRGEEELWLIDPQTHLPVRRTLRGAYLGLPTPQQVAYADYREVAGVMIPHRVDSEIGNDQRLREVRTVRVDVPIDVPVDADLFTMPEPEPRRFLRRLAGDWTVEYEHRSSLAAPLAPGTTSARIELSDDGGLLVESLALRSGGLDRSERRWWAWDQFADVARLTVYDDLMRSILVHEGAAEGTAAEGAPSIVVSTVATGTTWSVHDRTFHRREILEPVGSDDLADGFARRVETSLDGGATWQPLGRFVYRPAASALDGSLDGASADGKSGGAPSTPGP